MNWVDVESDIIRRNYSTLNNQLTLNEILKIITSYDPIIIFPTYIYEKILTHLKSNLTTELGGILTGNFFVDDNDKIKIIKIENSIESKNYSSTGVSLSMNSDIWNDVNNITKKNNSIVIGWYHSHPNLGAFFSSTDRYTQKHFFNNDYSLGLVIDPIRNEEKYFLNKNSIEIDLRRVLKTYV
jgi:proteasome lid subunit RPN8/RPN11